MNTILQQQGYVFEIILVTVVSILIRTKITLSSSDLKHDKLLRALELEAWFRLMEGNPDSAIREVSFAWGIWNPGLWNYSLRNPESH